MDTLVTIVSQMVLTVKRRKGANNSVTDVVHSLMSDVFRQGFREIMHKVLLFSGDIKTY